MIIQGSDQIQDTNLGKVNLPHDICLPKIIGMFRFKANNRFDPFEIHFSQSVMNENFPDYPVMNGKIQVIPDISGRPPRLSTFEGNNGFHLRRQEFSVVAPPVVNQTGSTKHQILFYVSFECPFGTTQKRSSCVFTNFLFNKGRHDLFTFCYGLFQNTHLLSWR